MLRFGIENLGGMKEQERQVATALISVFDKEGLEPLANYLYQNGVQLISTGGTQEFLTNIGLQSTRVEEITGYPSMLGGRVKTLHPLIFGGILSRREETDDARDILEYSIPSIDLVIVDLYPFEQALQTGASPEELIEKIDIGGVSLLRAAAKNFNYVLVASSKEQYAELIDLLEQNNRKTTYSQRAQWAAQAFQRTSLYESRIASYFTDRADSLLGGSTDSQPITQSLGAMGSMLQGERVELRYGENPHQRGIFVGSLDEMFEQQHGKKLSYNNLLDLDASVALIDEFKKPSVAVLKHGNPCGLGQARTLAQAWALALAGDPQSAFGGIIVANTIVDADTASRMDSIFFEACIAPDFEPEALRILSQRKNRILLKRRGAKMPAFTCRSVLNGFLVQERDTKLNTELAECCVTAEEANPECIDDLLMANKIVKHCKSNAIVIVKNGQLIGVGCGETSRVDAVAHAIEKAQKFGHETQGAVLASDAYFPFADSVQAAAKAGIVAIIQPGGSIRDNESIQECDSNQIAMYCTGFRHFKH